MSLLNTSLYKYMIILMHVSVLYNWQTSWQCYFLSVFLTVFGIDNSITTVEASKKQYGKQMSSLDEPEFEYGYEPNEGTRNRAEEPPSPHTHTLTFGPIWRCGKCNLITKWFLVTFWNVSSVIAAVGVSCYWLIPIYLQKVNSGRYIWRGHFCLSDFL